jgi:hypothetical protein
VSPSGGKATRTPGAVRVLSDEVLRFRGRGSGLRPTVYPLGMGVRKRLLPLLISFAVGIVVGVAVTLVYRGGPKEVSAVPAEISVLRQPPTSLPRQAVNAGLISPTEARLAISLGNIRYFVGPGSGRASGDLCLVESKTDSTATTCFGRTALSYTAGYLASPGPSGTIDLAGIAADAFDRASMSGVSTRIVNNVFVFRHVPATDHLTMYGPQGQLRVDLGAMSPTRTVTQPTS